MDAFGTGPIEPLNMFGQNIYLETIEYVMHELAHGLTMGFEKFPSNVSAALPTTMARYGEITRDHLEIDTSFVTFHAMRDLHLVKQEDSIKFANKCAEAMDSVRYNNRPMLILSEFEVRGMYFPECGALSDAISELLSMMRAPLKLVVATFAIPETEPPSHKSAPDGP